MCSASNTKSVKCGGTCACNPSTQETEAWDCEFEATLDNIEKACLETKQIEVTLEKKR